MACYSKKIDVLKKEVKIRYGEKALACHIMSVAEFADKIAESSGKPSSLTEKVIVASLAHDLYKGYSEKELRKIIKSESVPVDSESMKLGGGLLHAPVAANYVRTALGITDREILLAVYYHTTSRAGASDVEKVLYCADYLDPTRKARKGEKDLPVMREKVFSSLDEVYREVLARKLIYTVLKGRKLHSNGIAAWNRICADKIPGGQSSS